MRRRRVLRWSLGLFAATWLVFTFNAPACVYLPSVAGRPAVMRRIVGADAQGRVHWLEAERDVAFAWGIRWWFYPIPHAFTAEFGFEYVPPLRFAKGPWARWRMMRSDGEVRPYAPPLEPDSWPGATALSQLARTRPYVTDGGGWLVFQGTRLYSLPPSASEWVSRPVQLPGALPHSIELATALRSDGKIIGLDRIRPEKGYSEPWQDPLVVTVTDPVLGNMIHRVNLALPGERPTRCGWYSIGLAATETGAVVFEACSQSPKTERGAGRVFKLSPDYTEVEMLSGFDCQRTGRLAFSASADGLLFTTGEAVYRITGERLRSVGPFSSSVWIGHTLVGVRRYPFFAERVLDRKKPMGEILRGLRVPGSVRGPGEWRGARDLSLYIEIQDAAGAIERGPWWFGGNDESGKADEIERVAFE